MAALLVLVACCCSSSSVGAYFALNKNAKYYEDEIDKRIDKVIESKADPKDCKELRDFVIDKSEDMKKKEVNLPRIGTKKGDILDTIMSWDILTNTDTQVGRTKQEKLATLCDSKTGIDLVSEAITKIKNKDTSVCSGYDNSKTKSIPEFIWDEETENFIKFGTYSQNEIKKDDVESTFKKMCDPSYVPEIPYEDLSENAKKIEDVLNDIVSNGFRESNCLGFSENWKKMIDEKQIDEITNTTDPEIGHLYKKYKKIMEPLLRAFYGNSGNRNEIPEGVCISDLKSKIDEKVALLKNGDISGCDLYDDTWHIIRKDWNSGLIWDNENNKTIMAYQYAHDALGETDETIRTMTTFKETLCAPTSSPGPSQNIIDHDTGSIEITSS